MILFYTNHFQNPTVESFTAVLMEDSYDNTLIGDIQMCCKRVE